MLDITTKQSSLPTSNNMRQAGLPTGQAGLPTGQAGKNAMKSVVQTDKSLFQLPKKGDVVEGKIIDKEGGVLYIDLGHIGTGVVYGAEYLKAQDEIKKLKPGDELTAKVIEVENEDGYRELSLKEAKQEKNWQHIQESQRNKKIIEIEITDANKGGLMGVVGDVSGFLPVSQLAPAHYPRVEGGDKNKILQELRGFIGKKMQVQILDADQKENKLIFSEKAAGSESVQIALGKYKIGDEVEGEITGVVDFGAFIKFDPLLEGLIHISELDWSLIEDPHDIVKVGDKMKAKIVDIAEDGKVSLSLKALKNNPWEGIEKKYKAGDQLEAEVAKISAYGALVKIEEGIQGLLHISEFKDEQELKDKLKEGKKYKFEITSIDPAEYKIALKLAE